MAKTHTEPSTRESHKSRIITFLLHFVAVVLLFSLPEMFQSFNMRHAGVIDARIYIKPLILIAIFYINYYVFFPLCYGRRHSVAMIIILNVALIGAAMSINTMLLEMHHRPPLPEGVASMHPHPMKHNSSPHNEFIRVPVVRDMLMYILTATLSIFVKLSLRITELEKTNTEQVARQKAEELSRLKEQIRPHFLFNALNTIYALIDLNPEAAKKAVHRISQMLRYVLYDTGGNVTLRNELEFIESYVSLMAFRMPKSTVVSATFDPGVWGEAKIAPLIFINLVENAFKHGRSGSGHDKIEISITASPDGIVTCATSNTIAAATQPSDGSHKGGVGLANLTRRLQLLYGSDASIAYGPAGDNQFKTLLTIKLHKTE